MTNQQWSIFGLSLSCGKTPREAYEEASRWEDGDLLTLTEGEYTVFGIFSLGWGSECVGSNCFQHIFEEIISRGVEIL